jgi:hypothetical protein
MKFWLPQEVLQITHHTQNIDLRDAKLFWLIAELRSWDHLFLQEKIELKKQLFLL